MKKLLLLLLLAGTARADGPLFRFKDTDTDQEFQNVYQSIRNPSISYGTANALIITSSTIRALTISTVTFVSSATISQATITQATISTATITNLVGTTTNNNAATGNVGQYIESVVGSTNFPASGSFGDITSINLTAGDWDVSLNAEAELNAAVITGEISVGISATTGNSGTGLVVGSNLSRVFPPTTGATSSATVAVFRVSIASSAPYYGKFKCSAYTGGPPIIGGARLSARRVR